MNEWTPFEVACAELIYEGGVTIDNRVTADAVVAHYKERGILVDMREVDGKIALDLTYPGIEPKVLPVADEDEEDTVGDAEDDWTPWTVVTRNADGTEERTVYGAADRDKLRQVLEADGIKVLHVRLNLDGYADQVAGLWKLMERHEEGWVNVHSGKWAEMRSLAVQSAGEGYATRLVPLDDLIARYRDYRGFPYSDNVFIFRSSKGYTVRDGYGKNLLGKQRFAAFSFAEKAAHKLVWED